jgi:hypothetical protein
MGLRVSRQRFFEFSTTQPALTSSGKGRERAKARGVKMGRKPKLTDHQAREAIKRRDLAEIGGATT